MKENPETAIEKYVGKEYLHTIRIGRGWHPRFY